MELPTIEHGKPVWVRCAAGPNVCGADFLAAPTETPGGALMVRCPRCNRRHELARRRDDGVIVLSPAAVE